MNLEQYSAEELKEFSMIELAHLMLESKREVALFPEMVQEIAQTLGLSQEELAARISQFYTDLNIDGRFITLGENRWGLRSWYPYEQIDEEILPQPKPKKKRKLEEDEADEFVAEDDDFDDIDEIDDLDEDAEDFDDESADEDDLDELDELEEIDDDFVDEDEAEYDDEEEEKL
ncbi:DNA-directed RNA polymerase subunit delta [Microbacteriaceae bacterium 4G12]